MAAATPLLYPFPDNAAFARGVARAWPADVGELALRHFPDGESLVRLVTDPRGRDVAIVCTLRDPDTKLLPLLLAAATARELGARSVGLIAPYLAYLRQDTRFHAGEAVSAPHFAQLVASRFDWLVTVDPHLHRYHALGELYRIPATVVPAAPRIAQWIGQHVDRPLLIGPDVESRQWLTRIAEAAGAPWLLLAKTRLDDRHVEIRLPDLSPWRAHTPVLVDDIISTGGTLAEVVQQLREKSRLPPVCVAVHAVFAEWSYWTLLEAGAERIVTTNTIEHASNAIDVTPDVAAAARALVARVQALAAPAADRRGAGDLVAGSPV